MDWINEHIQQGGILGAIAVGLFFLVKWFFKRELRRLEEVRAADERRFADHETRLRIMEANRITQDHIDELRMSLMATITNAHTMLTKRMDDVRGDIATLTKFLLERK